MLCRIVLAVVLIVKVVSSEIIEISEEENVPSMREGRFFGIFGFVTGLQIAKLLQPQYIIIGDRWNTFLNLQYDQMDFPPTKPIKPDNTFKPSKPLHDTIIVDAATTTNSTTTTTPRPTAPLTTTIRPKLRKSVKKKIMRLVRASEKPNALRQEEPASEEETTISTVTETTTDEKESETEVASTDQPISTTINENIESSSSSISITTETPPMLMNEVTNIPFTGYDYNKPSTQFDTPPSVYYDNNLIHDLNKFVPSLGTESWSNQLKPSKGYGYSTNDKIELISLTTDYPRPVRENVFKPSSSDTFQNLKNNW